MPRPLRFEFEGAWYHVMNRGANHQAIYINDYHRYDFLKVLARAVSLYAVEIHAYCLMDNHYHLLIRTPRPNLSRAMQFINSVYSARFNKIQERDGPLFRGRFKAVLVENNKYLYQVSRYIHLNPVEAKLAKLPEEYRWSSYLDYLEERPCLLPELKTSEILLPFNSTSEEYQQYVNQGIDEETLKFYQKKKTSSVYGEKKFKKAHLKKLTQPIINDCSIDYNFTHGMFTIEEIVDKCVRWLGYSKRVICCDKSPGALRARKVAVYCSRKFTASTIKEISDYFGYVNASRIRQICAEVEKGDLFQQAKKLMDL